MDGPGKLTRTNSSLLRSSPTVRSSIQIPSSIINVHDHSLADDVTRRKKATSPPNGPHQSKLVLLSSVGTLTLIFALFFYYYINAREITASENLLFGLILIAVALFYLGKNRYYLDRTKSLFKTLPIYAATAKTTNNRCDSVEWFIGEDESENQNSMEIREGVEFYSNGDYYEGEFYRGKSNGNGVYTYSEKGRYEGEWVNGKYEGYGIESWAKGSRYKGMYRVGLRNGYGVYRFFTGDSYCGEWCNGQYHGIGVQSCFDGSCFIGEFKFGAKHGLGSYHFRNGDRYAGEYFGDKIHGFGVYHFANGHCYEGSWHGGLKQGFGMYTFRNGEAKCGEWNCGSLKTPLQPLTNSVLRAVQAARKAAENAINLRTVDEQVDKAVVGANRAATAARVAAVKAFQNRMDGKFYDTYALI